MTLTCTQGKPKPNFNVKDRILEVIMAKQVTGKMAKHIYVFVFVFKIFPGWEYTFFCDS